MLQDVEMDVYAAHCTSLNFPAD